MLMRYLFPAAEWFPLRLTLLTGYFLLLFFIPVQAQEQEPINPSGMASRALLKSTRELVESGEMEEVIPYLEEIVVRFEAADGEGALEARVLAMFQLGMCRLETEQYQKAAEVLSLLLQSYPNHSLATPARFLVLEAYSWLDDPVPMKTYIEQMKSSGAFEQLLAVFEDPALADSFRHAALALAGAYARAAELENVHRFLPYCDESARSDPGLNLALIAGGDRAFKQKNYMYALMFYRMVKTSGELMKDYDRRLAGLKAELGQPPPWVPQRRRDEQLEDQEDEKARYQRMLAERDRLVQKNLDLDVMMRIAQCYDATERYRHSHSLYKHICTAFPDHRLAEQCRYSAFQSLMAIEEREAALAEGFTYIELYPNGRFRDETTLSLMHLYLGLGTIKKAGELGHSLRAQHPFHRYLDQVIYLLGYIRFQEKDYEKAALFFKETAEIWPDRIYAEESTYWVGMCQLFLGHFKEAISVFDDYLIRSVWSPKAFGEDATYRFGMAYYGLGDFEVAEKIFRRFSSEFPESDLVSEACTMIGDLRGAEGDLEAALDFYARARTCAVTPEQESCALFQTARVYELQERYSDIIGLMEQYLSDRGTRGDFIEATRWIAKSWKAQGEESRALDIYSQTLLRYGNDPQLKKLDLLIRQMIQEARESGSGDRFIEQMKKRLDAEYKVACNDRAGKTLRLRLSALFSELTEGSERTAYVRILLAENNFESFSPFPLLVFVKEAAAKGEPDRVQQAMDYLLEAFGESEHTLDMVILQVHALMGAERYQAALVLVQENVERGVGSVKAGTLQKLAGDAWRELKEYDRAVEVYNKTLTVREWRGPLTPQVIYWIGICRLNQERTQEAFACFQRVYVLYDSYPEWVAKAYEGSLRALRILGREDDIVETWREMVANPNVCSRPEGRRAQAALDALPQDITHEK